MSSGVLTDAVSVFGPTLASLACESAFPPQGHAEKNQPAMPRRQPLAGESQHRAARASFTPVGPQELLPSAAHEQGLARERVEPWQSPEEGDLFELGLCGV
jgi:hypothetical protein